jgi:hypothetical protein
MTTKYGTRRSGRRSEVSGGEATVSVRVAGPDYGLDVPFRPILLKKSEYRPDPIFSAPCVRFSNSDAGGLIIPLRLNGASSKSICGGK